MSMNDALLWPPIRPPKGDGDGRPMISGPSQQSSAGRYGVVNSTPMSIMGMIDPTGIIGLGALGMRGSNISKSQGVQASLGMPQSSMFQALNPFSGVARGSPTASLGRFRGTPVSFGGVVSGPFGGGLQTSYTPQEAIARQNAGKAAANRGGYGGRDTGSGSMGTKGHAGGGTGGYGSPF
jgi:hypothetical protein